MKAEGAKDDLSRGLGGQGESGDLSPDPQPIFGVYEGVWC